MSAKKNQACWHWKKSFGWPRRERKKIISSNQCVCGVCVSIGIWMDFICLSHTSYMLQLHKLRSLKMQTTSGCFSANCLSFPSQNRKRQSNRSVALSFSIRFDVILTKAFTVKKVDNYGALGTKSTRTSVECMVWHDCLLAWFCSDWFQNRNICSRNSKRPLNWNYFKTNRTTFAVLNRPVHFEYTPNVHSIQLSEKNATECNKRRLFLNSRVFQMQTYPPRFYNWKSFRAKLATAAAFYSISLERTADVRPLLQQNSRR